MLINDSFSFPFSTFNSTRNLADTDSTPTGVLRKNGTVVTGASITVTKTGTGEYRADVVFASGDGWAIGDNWTFRVSYAINSVNQSIPWSGKIRGDTYSKVNTALPGVAAGASGGLPLGDASGRVLLQPNQTGATVGTVNSVANPVTAGTVSDKSGYSLSGTQAFNNTGQSTNMPAQVKGMDANTVTASAVASDAVTELQTGIAKPGDAMTLTVAERDAVAVKVESHLLDEGDSQMLINAIVAAIGNTNVNQTALVAAIRSDIERTGGTLALMFADYARRSGDYATAANVASVGTQVGNLNNLSQAQAQTAAANALNGYDAPTRLEATADKEEILSVANLVKQVTDKLNLMIKASGADWQWDTLSLALAPTGSGGGTAPVDNEAIADAVWTRNARTVDSVAGAVTVGTNLDKAGYALSSSAQDALAVVIESHLLNEGDGQMLVNAIVGAIGNSNIDQVAFVSALVAAVERAGGTLANMSTNYARRTDIPSDYQQRGTAVTLPAGVATTTKQDQILAAFGNINLSADQLDAIALAILTRPNGVETGYTLQQVLRVANAIFHGNKDGSHFRDPANSKNRITFSVDDQGNRTVVARDLT